MSSLSSGLSLACKAALSCSSLDWVGEAILSASDLGWVGEATPSASGLAWVGEATLSASGVNVAGRLFTHKGYSLPPQNSLWEPSLELVQKGLELFLVLPDLLVLGQHAPEHVCYFQSEFGILSGIGVRGRYGLIGPIQKHTRYST